MKTIDKDYDSVGYVDVSQATSIRLNFRSLTMCWTDYEDEYRLTDCSAECIRELIVNRTSSAQELKQVFDELILTKDSSISDAWSVGGRGACK